MNLLKSIFMPVFMMSAAGGIAFSLWSILNGGSLIASLGVLLTTAPFIIFIGYLMMFQQTARTSSRFPLIITFGAVGIVFSGFSLVAGQGDSFPLAVAISEWIAFLIYSFWYSSFGRKNMPSKIIIGQSLPSFQLKNVLGDTVLSEDLLDKPVIFIFYRGNWCPFCMAQIKELVAEYDELKKLGVRVAFIAPQPHEKTESIAKKYNATESIATKFGIGVSFFTDIGNQAARTLDIAQEDGLPFGMQMLGYSSETVMPTVIITDGTGKVIWADETDNYRVRPEPKTYLVVPDKVGFHPTDTLFILFYVQLFANKPT